MGDGIRSGYPTDVTDEERTFVAIYLPLCGVYELQRNYPLRGMFNVLCYVGKTGCHLRMLPNELPPWIVVYQQMRRWTEARCFEAMVEGLRILLWEYAGCKGQPTAMIPDSRTLQSTPASGGPGGFDEANPRKGTGLNKCALKGNPKAFKVQGLQQEFQGPCIDRPDGRYDMGLTADECVLDRTSQISPVERPSPKCRLG